MENLKGSMLHFLKGMVLVALIGGMLLAPDHSFAEDQETEGAKTGKPSVLFMIAEQNIGQEFFIFWWGLFSREIDFKGKQLDLSVAETTLKEAFINEGFEVVDVSSASDKIKVSQAYKLVDLTKEAAIEMGKNVRAKVVVTGKVVAKAGPKVVGSNVGSYLADMTATAFRVDDGAVLGAGKGHGVARHISEVTGGTEAIEKASKEVAEKLMTQISNRWNGGASKR